MSVIYCALFVTFIYKNNVKIQFRKEILKYCHFKVLWYVQIFTRNADEHILQVQHLKSAKLFIWYLVTILIISYLCNYVVGKVAFFFQK